MTELQREQQPPAGEKTNESIWSDVSRTVSLDWNKLNVDPNSCEVGWSDSLQRMGGKALMGSVTGGLTQMTAEGVINFLAKRSGAVWVPGAFSALGVGVGLESAYRDIADVERECRASKGK